jgi:phospholipid/cholesterol/gamma-HCH transport system substrate-binding protein
VISRRVIINLIAFFGLTGLLVVYGFFTLIHNPLDKPTTLYSFIDDTGGVRSGFTVALRGVPVGHVGTLQLRDVRQPDGSMVKRVRISLAIDHGITVPSDSQAEVERANPLGEQEVNLITGPGDSAPPARDGAILRPTATPTPPDVGQVVDAADHLFSAVPTGDLETVIHQLALAFNGRSQDIRTIIEESDVLSRNFLASQAAFRQLLAAAPPVLDTVASVGPQLHDALANTQLLLDLLNQRKTDIVNLAKDGTSFAVTANQFLADNTANLACFTKDLGDLGSNLSANPNYTNLDHALLLNQAFFGPINKLTPSGSAVSLGTGSVTHDQSWFRVRTLLPPQMPSAVTYPTPHQIPDTYPGAACLSVFGNGVPAGSQADASPPSENGKVIPAPAPTVPVEKLPPPTSSAGGTGPGNVLGGTGTAGTATAGAAGLTSPVPAAAPRTGTTTASRGEPNVPTGHPETALFVGGGLLGLGALERREIRKLRRLRRRRRLRGRRQPGQARRRGRR